MVIHSKEKNDFLGKLYESKIRDGSLWFWIGAKRDEKDPDSFLWTDRSGLEYEHWYTDRKWGYPPEPNNLNNSEDCVVSGWEEWTTWNDYNCDHLGYSVCEK